jgi:hypothetical protein
VRRRDSQAPGGRWSGYRRLLGNPVRASEPWSTQMRSSPTPSACSPSRSVVGSCCTLDARAYPTSNSFIPAMTQPAAGIKSDQMAPANRSLSDRWRVLFRRRVVA